MQRGEVWWALVDELRPVVLLSGAGEPDLRAMQVVAPAAAHERRGFVVLSGEEAADPATLRQAVDSAGAGAGIGGVGVEIAIGAAEGLLYDGVVRLAFPRGEHIFCTWLVTLPRDSFVEQVGALSSTKLDQLSNALHLARVE
jgi:mRNA interferase MazF